MLDVRLAAALLEAVGPRTHVLLVGDVDQLAPVGPGRVLEDLIASGAVPATKLTEVFRQAARSLIIRAAHAIQRRAVARAARRVTRPGRRGRHPRLLPDRARQRRAGLRRGHLPGDAAAAGPLRPRSGQRRCRSSSRCTRAPPASTRSTRRCAPELNPDGRGVKGTPFRLGDRVMQTRNNHERNF